MTEVKKKFRFGDSAIRSFKFLDRHLVSFRCIPVYCKRASCRARKKARHTPCTKRARTVLSVSPGSGIEGRLFFGEPSDGALVQYSDPWACLVKNVTEKNSLVTKAIQDISTKNQHIVSNIFRDLFLNGLLLYSSKSHKKLLT